MANELTSNFGFRLVNGKLTEDVVFESIGITQSTAEFVGRTESVTTAEADLDTTGITTLGYVYLKNLDATHFITYGPKSGGSMVALGRLKAGEHTWLRLEPGITLRWIADTATVKVLVKLLAN